MRKCRPRWPNWSTSSSAKLALRQRLQQRPLRPEPESPPGDLIALGRVLGAWGVRGWIKIQPFSETPAESVLLGVALWWLMPPDAARGLGALSRPSEIVGSSPQALSIERARVHGDTLVARVAGMVDRAQAEALRGRTLALGRSSFPAAGDDAFYWVDLIGCTVVNPKGDAFGTVLGVDHHGAHALLRVQEDGSAGAGLERLIPFVAHFVLEVDLAARRILVDWELDY